VVLLYTKVVTAYMTGFPYLEDKKPETKLTSSSLSESTSETWFKNIYGDDDDASSNHVGLSSVMSLWAHHQNFRSCTDI